MIAEFSNGLCQNSISTKRLDNSYCHQVVAVCGMFYHPYVGCLSWEMLSLTQFARRSLSFILGIDFFIGAIIFGLMASIIVPTSRTLS